MRVSVLAILGLIGLLIIGAATSSRFIDAQASAKAAALTLQPAADSASDLVISITEMDRGVRGFVITGHATALSPYSQGLTSSAESLTAIATLLADSGDIWTQSIQRVADARVQWIKAVARPTNQYVREGNNAKAEQLLNSDAAAQTYAILEAEAGALQGSIDGKLSSEFADLTSFARQLAVALGVSAVILLVGLIAAVVLVHRWVIRPLDHLRFQLREVARKGQHEVPIAPAGPPELFDAGRDAEEMRRQLVTEIDEARMAREGLEQEGPVVAAIRAELSRPQVAYAPGLNIYGDLQPAEGVLAGDWWDVFAMPDGRTAIVVADVSGHGPAAGIAGLRLKLVLGGMLESGSTAVDAIRRATALFSETPSRFATCAVVVLDPANHEVEWVNAGHLFPLIINSVGEGRELGITGPLLSALGGQWHSESLPMDATEVLFMWTDGISESRDLAGEQLEDSGLRELLAERVTGRRTAPDEIVPAVLALARNRSVDWRRDDVTLIAAAFSTG